MIGNVLTVLGWFVSRMDRRLGWGLCFQLTLDSRNAEKVAAWHYKTVDICCVLGNKPCSLTIGDVKLLLLMTYLCRTISSSYESSCILILINIYPQLLQIHPRTSHSSNGLSLLDNGRTCAEHRINFHHKAWRQGSNNPHWFRLTTAPANLFLTSAQPVVASAVVANGVR